MPERVIALDPAVESSVCDRHLLLEQSGLVRLVLLRAQFPRNHGEAIAICCCLQLTPPRRQAWIPRDRRVCTELTFAVQ